MYRMWSQARQEDHQTVYEFSNYLSGLKAHIREKMPENIRMLSLERKVHDDLQREVRRFPQATTYNDLLRKLSEAAEAL